MKSKIRISCDKVKPPRCSENIHINNCAALLAKLLTRRTHIWLMTQTTQPLLLTVVSEVTLYVV